MVFQRIDSLACGIRRRFLMPSLQSVSAESAGSQSVTFKSIIIMVYPKREKCAF